MIFWNNVIIAICLTDFIDAHPRLLHLGCENPGVKIESISTFSGVPDEVGRRLQWTFQRKVHRIKSLDNMKNHVHIDDETMALKYVRLYTSSETWYQWSAIKPIIEVVNERIAKAMPTYGLDKKLIYEVTSKISNEYKVDADGNDPNKLKIQSGFFCVLSPGAYAYGKFEAPIVKTRRNNFVIKRWVLCDTRHNYPNNYIVEEIIETVGRNGSYIRSIARRKPLPKLPDTYWYIPTFE